MTLRSIQRSATPVALAALLFFGCTTVRAPASTMGSDVAVGTNGADHPVELWLESGGPISEAEKLEAVAQVRAALDQATATLGSEDDETLLVVRAQGIARTGSRKANQQAAKVGIAVGAVALVAIIVVAAVSGKGGGGAPKIRGGGGVRAPPVRAAPRVGGRFRAGPPRFFFPARAPRAVLDVQLQVPAPLEYVSGPEGERTVAADERIAEEERTAFPPPEPITLHLPPPRPLDLTTRKFFDKDYTRLELLVVDRDTGRPTWVKTVDGKVDPRDPRAVKALLAKAIQEPDGWVAAVP
jgi:hypothetical protein